MESHSASFRVPMRSTITCSAGWSHQGWRMAGNSMQTLTQLRNSHERITLNIYLREFFFLEFIL